MRDQERAGAPEPRRLTTRETAERLGVKPETVYAYVSRGQLTSRRGPGRRGSTFDAAEVDALAGRNRRESAPSSGLAELSVRTRLTLIEEDRYFFRGVDATQLAAAHSFEEVAEWLWTGALRPGARFTAPKDALTAARRAAGALPEHAGTVDRLRVAAVASASADPLRYDLSEPSVLGAARALIPTLAATLPLRSATYTDGPPIAQRLWGRLSHQHPDEASLRVLDQALALLVDHDLAASTLAVRVAASARAHAYAAVSAGLGVLEGPLHGAASGLAHRFLLEVLDRGNAGPAVADELRAGRRIPGLGHRHYKGEDPRAQALFTALEGLPGAGPALAAAHDVVATTARHTDLHANVDLALAVLTTSYGMPEEAGETIFAVARTAGWIAHALEEYDERPLRMRPTGHYIGARPPQPLPAPPGARPGSAGA
ncbi:helix-turn-helix domain-containing protein [Streptomyces sp. SID5785]|uniref:citrate synthase n=1 Tax=Streptomyces sp. SID5785 TaxID=2690309 RepID=UPI001360E3A6|nr:citrate synthase [Streptomyces sp. SID5785]MZD10369.1 helix-turn-helix domain-containing protein [Streptomyces sp. SID5785]MZD10389.1 helix-turn-helix domain-containing protein [Streptomyces sp. SID5785]